MDQDQVKIIERKIAEDRGLSRENVEILKHTFKTEGCLRLEPKHHIPAIIDQQTLDLAINSSPAVSLDTLLDNPKKEPPELNIPPGYSLECIHGRHRVQAGNETLAPRDKWWTVDLYLDDASLDLRTALSEEYSNSINFSDGEIYQKIHYYKSYTDRSMDTGFAEKQWWARLKGKQKDLKMMFDKHPKFTAAFDALLVIPGIWGGLRIGMIHKVLALKCDEELLQYLQHILTVWSTILGKNEALMRITDQTTVKALEVRAPGDSKADLAALEPLFRSSELFSAVQSPDDRKNIWNNLQQVKGLIPIIESFFEDFKYLGPPARIMRQLFGKTKRTVYKEMDDIFLEGGSQLTVQDSDQTSYSVPGNETDRFEFGYRQVWLYAWRHFLKLIPECPRKEDGQPTPVPQEPSKYRWCQFPSLASQLGFQSDQINRLMSLNPYREIARDALLKAHDLDDCEYEEAVFGTYQDQIARIIQMAMTRVARNGPRTYTKPTLSVGGPGEALERRCGRTFGNAYKHDRKFLFLDSLYDPVAGEREGISSFYVRSSVYFAFFGRPIRSSFADSNSQQERPTQGVGAGNETPSHNLETQPSQSDGPQEGHPQSKSSIRAISPDKRQMTIMPAGSEMETTPEASNTIALRDDQEDLGEDTEMEIHRIVFKVWEDGRLTDQRITTAEMSRPQVEQYVRGQIGAGMCLVNTRGRILNEGRCYDAVVRDGTKTIIFTPRDKLDITRQMIEFARQDSEICEPSKRRQVIREENEDEVT
ncbi:MAG: hypothetical protein M1840_002674 [Geoglossum simile]|nr:MAG: hypothetical protein M1840_002674 [Geoglossum simile]